MVSAQLIKQQIIRTISKTKIIKIRPINDPRRTKIRKMSSLILVSSAIDPNHQNIFFPSSRKEFILFVSAHRMEPSQKCYIHNQKSIDQKCFHLLSQNAPVTNQKNNKTKKFQGFLYNFIIRQNQSF